MRRINRERRKEGEDRRLDNDKGREFRRDGKRERNNYGRIGWGNRGRIKKKDWRYSIRNWGNGERIWREKKWNSNLGSNYGWNRLNRNCRKLKLFRIKESKGVKRKGLDNENRMRNFWRGIRWRIKRDGDKYGEESEEECKKREYEKNGDFWRNLRNDCWDDRYWIRRNEFRRRIW